MGGRVIRRELAGGQPEDFRLAWHIDEQARRQLEDEIFGKHVLITSHDDWPVAEVVAGYRSRSEAEFGFRPSSSPHLMRRRARQAGLELSVRELFRQLAAIEETVLVYPSTGGRTKARRMTTELTGNQPQLYEIFGLNRWTPRS